MNDNSYRIIEVDINEILPNRFQPRIQFDEEEILELSDSIKEHGVIQPIVVRTIGDKYEIIAGERRYKASVLAGKESVPVIIKNLNDKDSAEIALIENIQRKNLTPIEEALSYKKILDMGYLTQESLAVKLGKSQSSVANKIRLLNLSDEVQEALLDNKISERHARSLLRLKTLNEQNKMLNRIITERLTVRKTDEEINKILDSSEEGEEYIKEKGEINMNNEMNQIPNIVTQQGNTFDIFGTVQSEPTFMQVPQPSSTVVNEIPKETQFSIPAMEIEQPVTPSIPAMEIEQPVTPSMPPMEAVQPVIPSVPIMEPVQPVMPSMPPMEVEQPVTPSIPTIEPVQPVIPSMPTMEIEPPVIPSVPSIEPVQPAMPSMPTMEVEPPIIPSVPSMEPVQPVIPPISTIIPDTKPIIESNVLEQNNVNIEQPMTNLNTPIVEENKEFKIPEPIIITDYNKQYDPIMPTIMEEPIKSDFKEIIAAIRECSAKIEKYGYKLDVEEYDLSTLYQVIFKIEK